MHKLGQVVAIVGAVGCGKSSLLSGLLGTFRSVLLYSLLFRESLTSFLS